VIYDAAHCFGTKYKEEYIFNYGDISITSFHATKVFHTVEGGGIFCSYQDVAEKAYKLANFGYDDDPYSFVYPGINAKNSEFHAAMGLCNLKYINELLRKRKQQWLYYFKHLNKDFCLLQINNDCNFNYGYFPVIFETEEELDKAVISLEKKDIYPRRYFYPVLSSLPYIEKSICPVAESISRRILCLPLYYDLLQSEQREIIEILKKGRNRLCT
jgi:dTDP-4-amino-4,6-dideoxygalactose transaminase